MHTRRAFGSLIVTALLVAACGAEGPRDKLRHAAFSFNEGLRWGRYNEVLPRVDEAAREHFMELHEEWGDAVRISSAEPVQYVIADDDQRADITVQFTWYRVDEMEVHTTRTVQHWEQRDGEWLLVGEEHLSGTPF